MSSAAVCVLGCGGHGRVVVQSLHRLGFVVSAVYDDCQKLWGTSYLGIPVVGPIERLADAPPAPTVIAIGDNAVRRRVADSLKTEWLTVVDPHAVVAPDAVIGVGAVVLPGAIVQAGAKLGRHVIVNNAASVDHDCIVGDYVHICPGARLAGGVSVGPGAFVGTGAVMIPLVTIGAWSVVGAGAVVVDPVPEGVLAFGNPARVQRSIACVRAMEVAEGS